MYYLFAHISLLLTHGLDFSIRYPSVICGVLLIPTAYWLGREYHSELVGLYCAGITTILLPLIYYSQYARAYEMSVLFFTIALILYIRLKRGDNHLDTRAAFWAMVVINVWTHLFVVIPLGILCLDLLLDHKHWFGGIMAGFCCLPLVSMLISVWNTRNGAGFGYGASVLQMLVLIPLEFFNSLCVNIFFLAGVGWWMNKDKLKIPLTICTVVTLIVGVLVSVVTPVFPRYLMSVSMIILLGASVGIVSLGDLLNKKVGKNLDYIVMILVFLVFVWMEWSNFMSHYFIMQYSC